ncbi:response regulator transcription factor [Streptomyces sp. NPDC051211]|uniref:response regulator transcription factor n=1 Tax=Streptomyces sp. NPDC051211 TaxID=3154643 RepID=UPI00344E919C
MRILAVEDEAGLAESLRRGLFAEGHWVDTAHDGHRTPVLMLTGRDGEYDEADGLDSGADDYLTKPFSFVVLGARLRALARRAGAPERTTLQAGDLSWTARAGCRRGTAEIELTARELDVLGCLMERPGRAVAEQDILDEVWETRPASIRTSSRCTSPRCARRSTRRSRTW